MCEKCGVEGMEKANWLDCGPTGGGGGRGGREGMRTENMVQSPGCWVGVS